MSEHRFPAPWTVDDADGKLDRRCFIVRDVNGQALAYVRFEDEPGRRAAAKPSARDKTWRIACPLLPLIDQTAGIEKPTLSARNGSRHLLSDPPLLVERQFHLVIIARPRPAAR